MCLLSQPRSRSRHPELRRGVLCWVLEAGFGGLDGFNAALRALMATLVMRRDAGAPGDAVAAAAESGEDDG